MFLIDAIRSSFQTILNHKFRSFLTLLGILIGITSVVAMFSSVNGIKIIITDNMEKMGWNNTLMITGGNVQFFARGGFAGSAVRRTAPRRGIPLSYRDYESLKANVDAKNIYGLIDTWEMSHSTRSWYRVRATTEDFFHANTYPLKEGRFFNAFELSRGLKVAIVGPFFAEDHFNNQNPLGQFYTAGKHRYEIIGILDNDPLNKPGSMQFNPWGREWDLKAIYIPLKTGAMYYRNNMYIDFLNLQAHDADSFVDMRNTARQVLLANRNMSRDFQFQDIGSQVLQMTQQMNEMLNNWSTALLVIASVSLLVGGIGLFSTLLISINERMSEIGIRKSVGARDVDIFFYFIIEAITLSIIASCLGIALGLLVSKGMGMAIKTQIPISMISIYVGVAFAVIIGFLSGLYPAIKAAKINPIQAIYYFE